VIPNPVIPIAAGVQVIPNPVIPIAVGVQVIPNPVILIAVGVQVNLNAAGVLAQVLVQAILIKKISICRLTLIHILIWAGIGNTNLFLNSLFEDIEIKKAKKFLRKIISSYHLD
jgi:hypothetical protein